MKTISQIVLILLACFSVRVSAQNLVLNPSFETITGSCGFAGYGSLNNWYYTYYNCSSPDWFATCVLFPMLQAPANGQGNQAPRTGNAYAGFISYDGSAGSTPYREYVEGELSAPLTAGQTYCVTFYISLADNSPYAVQKMGVYFSNTLIQNTATPPDCFGQVSLISSTPQLQHPGGALTDKTNWVQMQWSYTASGGEKYIIIGNFFNDANSGVVSVGGAGLPFAYYFIDDVSVVAGVCNSTFSVTPAHTDALCNGQCTGTATVTPTTGSSPYTYAWNNGQTTQTAVGLCAGTYTVTVTDAASSTATSAVVVGQPTVLTAAPSSTDVTCNGLSNGSASVAAGGGTAGYTYSWSNGKTTATITGLTAGTYTATVTDSKGCTKTSASVVTQPAPLVLNFPRTYYLCGEGGGSVQLTASGGTSYSWTPGATLDDATIANPIATPVLQITNYTVTVSNGACSDTAHVSIRYVPSPTPPTITTLGDSMWVSQNYVHYQWYLNGFALPNDTNFYELIHWHGSGDYTVYVTDSLGCKVISPVTSATDPSGVFENVNSHGIKIFPNPAGEQFEIQGLKFDHYTIELFDALGQIVYREKFTGNRKVIKGNWSTGVYFVRIENVKESFMGKIMIQ